MGGGNPARLGALLGLLFTFVPALARADSTPCRVKPLWQIALGLPRLDKEIRKAIAVGDATAISIAVIKNGHVFFERRYGEAAREPHFQAASISKPVTAFAALQLVQQKILGLNTPLTKYLRHPYLPAQPYVDAITLRTVLNHTSGLGDDVDGIDRKIYFEPGTDWSYSGAGFQYLQQVMEDAVGKPFNTIMVDTMKALGMNDSTFELSYGGAHYVGAAYSLVTTPAQLARFFDQLAAPARDNADVARAMTTPSYHFSEGRDFGLGVALAACGDDVAVRHSGCNFNSHRSQAVIYQKSRTGVVVMTRGKNTYGLSQRFAEMAIGGAPF